LRSSGFAGRNESSPFALRASSKARDLDDDVEQFDDLLLESGRRVQQRLSGGFGESPSPLDRLVSVGPGSGPADCYRALVA